VTAWQAAAMALAPWLGAAAASCAAYMLATELSLQLGGPRGATGRRLEQFAGAELPPSFLDRLGSRAIRMLGLDLREWELRLEWAQGADSYRGWTVGSLLGRALLNAVAGVLAALLLHGLIFWVLPALLFALPFIQVRSRSRANQREVARALPETATLVAAEVAAGNAPDQSLLRASELPGMLGRLLARAVAESRTSGRPLFSRSREVRGTLVDSLARLQLPELAAFGSQVDLVAAKGVAGAQLMDAIAVGLAREYRRHVLRAAEELESNLVMPAAVFFFLPFVIAIMVPLLLPLLRSF
jgi:Flp pilus assembly protein TadB